MSDTITPNNDQNNEPSNDQDNSGTPKTRVLGVLRHYFTGKRHFVRDFDPQSGRGHGTEMLGEAQDFGSVENARAMFEIMKITDGAEVWEVKTTASDTGEAVRTFTKHALMHAAPRYEKTPNAPHRAPTRFDSDDNTPLSVLRHGPAVHWNGQSFKGVRYENAVLHAVDFRRAEFENAEFENCLLVGCRFDHAEFHDGEFEGCDFIDCDFDRAEFNNGSFKACRFSGCFFKAARLEEVSFERVIFHATTFKGASIIGENLTFDDVEVFEAPWGYLEGATITLSEESMEAFGILLASDPPRKPHPFDRFCIPRPTNWTTEYPALAAYLTAPLKPYTPDAT